MQLLNVSGTRNESQLQYITILTELHNTTIPTSPVCLRAPFFFLLFNATSSNITDMASCNSSVFTCIISQCWNGTDDSAVVLRIPTNIPIPVVVDTGDFPVTRLFRHRRDFGITAALITAITLSATAATTAAIAMSAQVQTAEVINGVVEKTAAALMTQKSIDGHLKAGILVVNRRVDLLQEQIDDLVSLTSIGCIHSLSALCITSRMAENFTAHGNLSWQLSAYLNGNWSRELENLTDTLTRQIAAVNTTCLELPTVNSILSTLQQALSFLKEWAGVGAMFSMMLLAILVCLWCLYRTRMSQKYQAAMVCRRLPPLRWVSPPKYG